MNVRNSLYMYRIYRMRKNYLNKLETSSMFKFKKKLKEHKKIHCLENLFMYISRIQIYEKKIYLNIVLHL